MEPKNPKFLLKAMQLYQQLGLNNPDNEEEAQKFWRATFMFLNNACKLYASSRALQRVSENQHAFTSISHAQ